MSHYMTALAMKQKGLKPSEKIVLYWLADHYNGETGDCFPSIDRLAKCCEMSRRSVENQLKSLEGMGFVTREQRRRDEGGKTSNRYILNLNESDTQNLRMGSAKSAHGDTQNLRMNNLGINNLGIEPKEPSVQKDRFEEFWGVFPKRENRRGSKKLATAKYLKAVKDGISEDRLIAAAKSYSQTKQAKDGFAQNASTWLNQAGWEAEEASPDKTSAPVDRAAMAADSIKTGKAFLCTQITAAVAREAIERGLVTGAQCRAVNVSI